MYECNDVDSAYNYFINKFKILYNTHCPIKQSQLKRRAIQPWITTGLVNACAKKDQLYKEFVKNRTSVSETRFKLYRNRLNTILRFCKKDYYTKLLLAQYGNAKQTWNTLNTVLKHKGRNYVLPEVFKDNLGKGVSGKKNIANHFNDFFVNIGPQLADKIEVVKNDNIFQYMKTQNMNSMFLINVDEKEVLDLVNSCKSKTSLDSDGISMFTVRKVFSAIVRPFVYICNLSFVTGVFPSAMKKAKVCPIYKAGDKSKFNNYRPVSLLSQFSKILEKLFEKRLEKFINKHQIITENQYGFRSKRSTSLALLELIEELTTAIDKKHYTIGVFIDLSKAFDTIDHSLLLQKLKYYHGVRGVANNWVESYLSQREQFVTLNDVNSESLQVRCGVPQGSVLGPKLFILYINDIVNVSKLLKYILFADDTNIFFSGKNLDKICKTITIELEKLNSWFKVNKLSLNVGKTNFMVFCSYNVTIDQVKIELGGQPVKRVKFTKFLGVIIDEKLNWKEHVSLVCSKLNKCIAVLYRASFCVGYEALLTIYNSLFLPHLMYCSEIWGNTCKTALNQIFFLQKRAIRIVHSVGRIAHTCNLFHKSKALKFFDIVKFKSLILMYNAKLSLLPCNIQSYFKFNNTTTRQQGLFSHISCRTTKKSHCLSIKGVKLFNNLPKWLQNISTINSFRQNLKKYILSEYQYVS